VTLPSPTEDTAHQRLGADPAGVVDNRVYGVEPLLRLGRIRVRYREVEGTSVDVVQIGVALQFSAHGRYLSLVSPRFVRRPDGSSGDAAALTVGARRAD
jgi:hypothetical protein